MPKPQPNLVGMPEDIIILFFNEIKDTKSRLSLGLVSKDFRSLCAKLPMKYTKIELELSPDQVNVILHDEEWNTLKMEFHRQENSGVLRRNSNSEWEKSEEGEDYRMAAVQYFLACFNRKETKVNRLVLREPKDDAVSADYYAEKFVEDRKVIFDEFERILKSLKFQPLVEKLEVHFKVSEAEILQVIFHLKPRILTDIEISFPNDSQSILTFVELYDTEQWKSAKKLTIDDNFCDIPFDKLSNFRFVSIRAKGSTLQVKEIIENFINHQSLINLSISSDEPFNETGFDSYLSRFEELPNEKYREGRAIRLPNEPNTRVLILNESQTITGRAEFVISLLHQPISWIL